MNTPVPRDNKEFDAPALDLVTPYLRASGWSLIDEDSRTTMWRHAGFNEDLRVLLPIRQDVNGYGDYLYSALRVLSYVEQRSLDEITSDMKYGASDTVSIRLTPATPSGEAPLPVAYSALTALRSYVIGSAAALENRSLVLPAHRFLRAENYSGATRVTTRPGSFILSLTLPLLETFPLLSEADEATIRDSGHVNELDGKGPQGVQGELLQIPPQPFGRQVVNRMITAAKYAQNLASEVGDGNEPIRAFGRFNRSAANATELEALSALGGGGSEAYQVRFAQSPTLSKPDRPILLRITPGQQYIMREGANYLRTMQSRRDVTVQGRVVKLAQDRKSGPGEIVVEGVIDDSGQNRRFHVELAGRDYREAWNAHGSGFQVIVRGDLDVRGSYKYIRPLKMFSVVPGIGDDE